jgi:hypothetical protein
MEIKDIGFYCQNLFGSKDYFTPFLEAHTPQALTESDKADQAYRKGVYLSEVLLTDVQDLTDVHHTDVLHPTDALCPTGNKRDALQFHLLRCSSNLQGPTENFTDIDHEIIGIAQAEARKHYPDSANLNHVLAQVYYNHVVNNRDRRAKIPAHSDKTEDMPENGLIVFCTFYDPDALHSKKYHLDDGVLTYKNCSALTCLKFVNKETQQVTMIPLHPNSALFIDLNTNRTHTHEIIPPNLKSDDVPTRLGYVIRCSNVLAVHYDDQTYLRSGPREPDSQSGSYVKLLPSTPEKVKMLKDMYVKENVSTTKPEYPVIDFSLNNGDYLAPKLR